MSLTTNGVWAANVWASTVWADCVWYETHCTVAEVIASGGMLATQLIRRRMRR